MGLDARLIAAAGNVPNIAKSYIDAEKSGIEISDAREKLAAKDKLAQFAMNMPKGANVADYYTQGGFPEQGLEFAKKQAEIDKAKADAGKTDLESHLKMLDISSRFNQGLMSIPKGQLNKQAVLSAAADYAQQGFISQEHVRAMENELSKIPDNDAALRQIIDRHMQMGLEAKDKLSAAIQMRGQDITAQNNQLSQSMRAKEFGLNQDRFDYDKEKDVFDKNYKMVGLERQIAKDKQDYKKEQGKSVNQGAIDSIDTAMESLNSIIKHPGREAATGTSAIFNPVTIPGTDRAGFQARLETFKAQTFVPMVAQLKGMGALSDAEGKKLTAAVGALDPNMPESEFLASANEIMQELELKKQRALGNSSDRRSIINTGGATESYGIPEAAPPDRKKAYQEYLKRFK